MTELFSLPFIPVKNYLNYKSSHLSLRIARNVFYLEWLLSDLKRVEPPIFALFWRHVAWVMTDRDRCIVMTSSVFECEEEKVRLRVTKLFWNSAIKWNYFRAIINSIQYVDGDFYVTPIIGAISFFMGPGDINSCIYHHHSIMFQHSTRENSL